LGLCYKRHRVLKDADWRLSSSRVGGQAWGFGGKALRFVSSLPSTDVTTRCLGLFDHHHANGMIVESPMQTVN